MLRTAIDKILSVQSAKGSLKKKDIISKNKDDEKFKSLLYYALNPMFTYKISEKTLKEKWDEEAVPVYSNIFELCEHLNDIKAASDWEILGVVGFLKDIPSDEIERQFYKELLTKKLRLGVTAKTVNEVIPDLIPVWEVQQAYPIEKYPLKPNTWFTITEKLNGVRATYYLGKLYARSGVPFDGLDHITEELALESGFVFDGELILRNKDGLSDNEAFRKATGIINSDSDDKSEIVYRIFDMLPIEEFDGEPVTPYSRRRLELNSWFDRNYQFPWRSDCLIVSELYQGTDQSQIDHWLDWAVSEDKEGVMVNLDVPYQRKRHKGILKVKRFYTMDLPIIRCEEGSGRLSGTLGALVISFNGNEVSVGSGFTDDQRRDFWERREELEGLICEVKYKEISSDKKTGAQSLQFPVFVTLRIDKDTESYC